MADLNNPVLAERVEAYNRRLARKARPWWILPFTLLLAGLIGYIAYDSDRGSGRFELTQENADQIEGVTTRLAVIESLYDALYSQFESCVDQDTAARPDCAAPVAPPSEDVDAGEDSTTILNPQPSQEQVRAAVTAYCTDTGLCEGQVPTPEQVQAAVAGYCNANGQCRGATGDAGSTGGEGPQGDTGPPPSDAQVLAAVTAYCSTGACTGPQGPPGPPCPEGWSPAELLVLTAGAPVNIYTCTVAATEPPAIEEAP